MDDLKSLRGRRDSERRIQHHTKTSITRQNTPSDDSDLETYLTHYTNQASRLVARTYETFTDPDRKKEGKAILTNTIWHGVGVGARTLLGPRKQTQTSTKSTIKQKVIKIANPTLKIKPNKKRSK